MANTKEFRIKLNELLVKYPKNLIIIRNETDLGRIDIEKVMKNPLKDFFNTDDELLPHIIQCLQAGKEVAIQAAGKDKVLVFAAIGLFKRSF